nr:hypothetical protein [Vibrio panuliri]
MSTVKQAMRIPALEEFAELSVDALQVGKDRESGCDAAGAENAHPYA